MLHGILEGGIKFFLPDSSMLEVPKWSMNVPQGRENFEKVTLSVWPNKRIIIVKADGLPRGWFPVQRLKTRMKEHTATVITVNNFMVGVEALTMFLTPQVHAELLVWLDMLLEKGVLPATGPTTLSERELVRADPRVDEMHQEQDGFCDTEESWSRNAPPRKAWWVYITDTWYNDNMDGQTIHECNLKTVLEHLKEYVRPASEEEQAHQ